MSWTIYNKYGAKIATSKDIEYNGTFMDECYLLVTVKSSSPLSFNIGDYLDYRGERFTIRRELPIKRNSSTHSTGDAIVYEQIRFDNQAEDLRACEFMDIVPYDSHLHFTALTKFSFYATKAEDLAERIQANLDRIYTGDDVWSIKVAEGTLIADKEISVEKITCWDALKLFNSEFELSFIIRGRSIIIGGEGTEISRTFEYGKDKGLLNLERKLEDENVITRLRVYGSTRNLPYRYYNDLRDANGNPVISESMYAPNLMLPAFRDPANTEKHNVYLESKEGVKKYGIREGSVFFDGSDTNLGAIYPSIQGMTAGELRAAGITIDSRFSDDERIDKLYSAFPAIEDDGILTDIEGKFPVETFTVTLKDIGFSIEDYIISEDEMPSISMRSGECTGMTFEVVEIIPPGYEEIGVIGPGPGSGTPVVVYHDFYRLKCNRWIDNRIMVAFPNKNMPLSDGDEFVLVDLYMPDVYVKAAEQRLLKAGLEYLEDVDHSKFFYSPALDDILLARNPELYDSIKEGNILLFKDVDLNISERKNINKLIIREGNSLVPQYEVTMSDVLEIGTIEKLNRKIANISSDVSYSIESIVKSLSEGLWVKSGGKVYSKGIDVLAPDYYIDNFSLKKFFNLLEINEDGNGVIKSVGFKADLYATGGVSALGRSTGGSGSGNGGATSLGGLVNVDPAVDDIFDYDIITYKPAGATHFTSKKLSEVVGLDKDTLSSYLTTNGYATRTWVNEQGFLKSVSWDSINNKPTTFTPSAHKHVVSDITDFPTQWAWNSISGKPSTFYTLPNASASVLGGVKIGSGLAIDANGILSANLSASHIPGLDASKIISGTLADARIPSLSASKITSGTFDVERIPTLGIGKISGLQTALDNKLNVSTFDKLFTPIYEDGVLKRIQANFDFYSVGGMSALGWSEGGMGTGSGLIQTVYGYSDLGRTFSDTDRTATFNPYTTNQIHLRVKALEESTPLTFVSSGTGNVITGLSKAGNIVTYNLGLTALTGITKSMVEAVLTGNITSHTHNYLSAITKAQVEAVLTGVITSHSHTITWDSINGKPTVFYTLPEATASVLGGVKVGSGLAVSAGLLSVNLAASHIPNLDASKITSGVFADARIPALDASKITAGTLPIARGGTGKTSIAANAMYYASAANVLSEVATSAFGRGLLNAASGTLVTGLNSQYLSGYTYDQIVANIQAGNVASATKLQTARAINGTSFNGTADIVTSYWGTSRSFYISDATAANTGAAISVNGSGNVTLKLPATIAAALTGNASTATALATVRYLWGQAFKGDANVTGSLSSVENISMSGYLQIGSGRIMYDAANNALYVVKSDGTALNFYATGGNSALGFSGDISGGGGSGLIQTVYGYSDLGSTFLDTNRTNTFNAYTINYINGRVTVNANNITSLTSRIASLESGSALSITTSGSGNVITGISKTGTAITATKGYAVTAIAKSGSGNALTGLSFENGILTYTLGTIDISASLANYVTLNTAQAITGQKTFTTALILNNNIQLAGKDTSGASYNLAYRDSNNNSLYGTNAYPTYILSSNVNLYHRIATTDYAIWDASNSNLSTVNWAANTLTANTLASLGGLTVAGAASIAGALKVSSGLEVTGLGQFNNNLQATGAIIGSSTVQGTRFISTIATGTSPLQVNSTTLVNNLNAQYSERVGNFTNYQGFVASYMGGANDTTNGILITLPVSTSSAKMLTFTVRLYRNYTPQDIQISGYLYSATNQWHSPKAIMIAGSASVSISMGRSATGMAIVWIDGGNQYTGASIINVTGGYNSHNWSSGWSITPATKPTDATWALDSTIVYPNLTTVGNAASATKLYTPRSIWGQTFDGTGNISGAFSGATTGAFSSNVTVGGTLGVTGIGTFSSDLNVNGNIVSGVTISASPVSSFRSTIFGNTTAGYRIKSVRNNITVANFSEIYACALAVASQDTHLWLSAAYSNKYAWIGGGSSNVLNWSAQLFHNQMNLIPNATNNYSLGSSTYKWSAIYATNLYTTTGSFSGHVGIGGSISIDGDMDLYGGASIYNNLNVDGYIYAGDYINSYARIFTGYDSGVRYSISCSGWFRSNNATGWLNSTYSAGICSDEAGVVRTYSTNRLKVYNTNGGEQGISASIYTVGGVYAKKDIYSDGSLFAGADLEVMGSALIEGKLNVGWNLIVSDITSTGSLKIVSTDESLTASANAFYCAGGGAFDGNLWSKGGVSALGTSTSDMRLKENIRDFNGLSILRKIKPFRFDWNEKGLNMNSFLTNEYNVGISAQKTEKILPNFVGQFNGDYLFVKYEKFIPIVMKGVLEVDDKVTRLEKRVSALEKENEQLRNQLKQIAA